MMAVGQLPWATPVPGLHVQYNRDGEPSTTTPVSGFVLVHLTHWSPICGLFLVSLADRNLRSES